MADVSRRSEGTRRLSGVRGDDRGQLFIVGALALSVILVALAVLLNTAIYTGNVATRDSGVETTSVIEYENAAKTFAGGSMEQVNYRNNTTVAHLEANYSAGVANWSSTAGNHVAVTGADAHVQVNETTNGTRIVQDDQRAFTDATGAGDWQLAQDVAVRNFTVTVDGSTLPQLVDTDQVSDLVGSYRIDVVEADGDTWKIYFYRDGAGDVTVEVVDPSDSLAGECTAAAADPTIDLTNSSIGGTHCAPLDIWSGSDSPYDVGFGNGLVSSGLYSLVVDADHGTLIATGHYNDDTTGTSPFVTPAIYSATVDVAYQSPSVSYRTTRRVAPGEPDV